MSTARSVIEDALRRVGGKTGSISSGTATSVVLGGLVDTTGDDTYYDDWLLWMLDAASSADYERSVTAWDDSLGAATIATRADSTYTSEGYALSPPHKFALNDWFNSLNDRLKKTRRTVLSVIPTIQDERFYPLGTLTWVQSAEQVPRVYLRSSPNLIDNSDFNVWGSGPTAAPTGWVATSATIARNSLPSANVSHGYYSVSLTGSGAAGTLDYELDPRLVVQLRGMPVTFEADCVSASSSAAIRIVEDSAASGSDAHTGGGARETLSVTVTVGASTSRIRFRLESPDGTASHFDHAVAEEATSIQTLLQTAGDDAWSLQRIDATPRDLGGVTAVELSAPRGRRAQLVVASLQPFPELTSYTSETDCPDEVIVPGLLYELSRIKRAGVDRTYWDRIQGEQGREYAVAARRLQQTPLPEGKAQRVVVRGV